jgi:hypothetical protein
MYLKILICFILFYASCLCRKEIVWNETSVGGVYIALYKSPKIYLMLVVCAEKKSLRMKSASMDCLAKTGALHPSSAALSLRQSVQRLHQEVCVCVRARVCVYLHV